MKYCPYCGVGLDDNMSFCPKCGKRFVDAKVIEEKDEDYDTNNSEAVYSKLMLSKKTASSSTIIMFMYSTYSPIALMLMSTVVAKIIASDLWRFKL